MLPPDSHNAAPLVTIAAIYHQHGPYVLELLRSVQAQTYAHIELIFINNTPNDGCEDTITDWLRHCRYPYRYLRNEQPRSLIDNVRTAFAAVQGTYYQLISCDDVLLPTKIEKQVAAFAQLPATYACVYTDGVKIDEYSMRITDSGTAFEKFKELQPVATMPEGDLRQYLAYGPVVWAPTVLLRKSAVTAVGGYDAAWNFEDWPMWVRLSKGGFKFYPVEEVLTHYRVLTTSFDNNRSAAYYHTIANLYRDNINYLNLNSNKAEKIWLNSIYWLRMLKDNWLSSYIEFVRVTKRIPVITTLKLLLPTNTHFLFDSIVKMSLRK